MKRERRTLRVADNIIHHLIGRQAGSLGKAILECVMNSIDAAASSIRIDLDATTLRIEDDGHGLRTRDEVLKCFEVFGFDHTNHRREFGEFGLGRGQLWNFASTLWRTNEFLLDVDVRARGLDWELTSELEVHPGLVITGTFYEPMTQLALVDAQSEIERLCQYSTVPVFINGKQVSTDPAASKWTIETEDAYLRITEGYSLRVFNQGIHTCDLYTSAVGIAGVLVTKRGHSLKLNMARNDIQRSHCEVWKRLKPQLDAVANKGGDRKARMNAAQRDYMARQTADPANAHLLDEPLISLCNNRHINVRKLADSLKALQPGGSLTVAGSGNAMGDCMMRDRTAVVLARATLERFGALDIASLLRTLIVRLPSGEHATRSALQRFAADRIHEQITTCPGYIRLDRNCIPTKELTLPQRRFITAVGEMHWQLTHAIARATGRACTWRPVALGRATDADAFTDGSSYVAIVDRTADAAIKEGLPGFLRIAHFLVHELLHDEDDSGSHVHDAEFYEHFHDVVLYQHDLVFGAAAQAFRVFAKSTDKLSRRHAGQLDKLNASEASRAA